MRFSKGSVTVFFTLLSVIFLSVLFALLESVRGQGARAHAANIVEMGNYSLFSEYEGQMLADYALFGVDGSYGSGDFSISRVTDRWKEFLTENTHPSASGLPALCFDPWKIELTDGKIPEYTLLTDENGAYFYQQAVSFMRKTAITNITAKLYEWYRRSLDAKEKQESYQREKYAVDKEMDELEKTEKKMKEELEEQQTALEPAATNAPVVLPDPSIKNPLPALRRLARKDLLRILLGDFSGCSRAGSALPRSRRAVPPVRRNLAPSG